MVVSCRSDHRAFPQVRHGTNAPPKTEAIEIPYFNQRSTKGASREQETAVVREFTETLVRVLGKRPEHTHIVILEIDEEDWGFASVLTNDFQTYNGNRGGGLPS